MEEKDGVLVMDAESSKAWLIGIIFVRIRAQMAKQSLFHLEKMKAEMETKFKLDKVAGGKQITPICWAFFGRENFIMKVDHKMKALVRKSHIYKKVM